MISQRNSVLIRKYSRSKTITKNSLIILMFVLEMGLCPTNVSFARDHLRSKEIAENMKTLTPNHIDVNIAQECSLQSKLQYSIKAV